jgi:hypothetical protein
MLLRDAQEEARVLYAALRDSVGDGGDPLVSHVAEGAATLERLRDTERGTWGQTPKDRERAVGLMLLVALGLANELEVDSLGALRSVLLEESP